MLVGSARQATRQTYTLEKCLDLTDKHFIRLLSENYLEFIKDLKNLGASIPQNTDLNGEPNPNGVLRHLDCFLIEHFHSLNDIAEDIPYFDTVRGAFTEGKPAYPGTQFGDKNHIQVCIRNKKCIKGFFLPRCSKCLVMK